MGKERKKEGKKTETQPQKRHGSKIGPADRIGLDPGGPGEDRGSTGGFQLGSWKRSLDWTAQKEGKEDRESFTNGEEAVASPHSSSSSSYSCHFRLQVKVSESCSGLATGQQVEFAEPVKGEARGSQ